MNFSYAEAEAYLASLEPIGWRFGLDRMRRLVSVLGMPQHRFASIHVVGSNGKSSVTRIAAELLEAQGVASGAYLSPHVESWTERVRIGSDDIDREAFAAAVERAAQAAESVNRTLGEGDSVTQFELMTAAAFVALAAAQVQVAVIEAGLGGRLDATNVIPSRVTALPSISLEHTDLLGSTEEEIAAEKLDVLRPHSALVLGPVDGKVEALARRVAGERTARLTGPLRAPRAQSFLEANFAVATAAVETIAGPIDPSLSAAVASSISIPGVLEVYDDTPPVVLDAAHNPGGAKALADALPQVAGSRPVVACVAILEGKDVEAFARALAPSLSGVICTEVPADALRGVGRSGAQSARAVSLAASFGLAGVEAVSVEPDPELAVAHARELAKARRGVALVTGTHYLLRYAWTGRHAQNSSR